MVGILFTLNSANGFNNERGYAKGNNFKILDCEGAKEKRIIEKSLIHQIGFQKRNNRIKIICCVEQGKSYRLNVFLISIWLVNI